MHIYKLINDIAGDNNYSTILVVGHNPGLEELIEVPTETFNNYQHVP